MERFKEKVVIVTGGAEGIGKASVYRFAQEGARVAILDINEAAAKNLAAEVDGIGLLCDVSDPESVKSAVDKVLEKWARIDVLFANAGVYRSAPLVDLKLEDWQLVLNVNLTGVMLACQAVAPTMIEQNAGSIVVMSSMGGKTSWPASAAYSATKTGEIGIVRSVAQELGPYNINCNAVCLGHADTFMMREVDRVICEEQGLAPGSFLAELAQENPMKRLGTVEETAALVAFLASEEARYINGQAIEIDGGRIMS
jgi:NAD(P)-dependent dehydrogenase (short-subunit alcohol dehydrogenase family)